MSTAPSETKIIEMVVVAVCGNTVRRRRHAKGPEHVGVQAPHTEFAEGVFAAAFVVFWVGPEADVTPVVTAAA